MTNNMRNEITPEQRAFAENALHGLPFARLIGMRLVDIVRDAAVISIDMRDDLRQPSGVLHGGVTATLIDTAMAFAVRTRVEIGEPTATIDLTVHYLRPVTEGRITCTATLVRAGRRIFTVSAEVHNEEGKLIATGLSTYTKV
ncbi:MAG: PaaI family thioesterase [Acidobacteria bacterium]|nr:PaaI family thioesterase [Acidobacteriota bacterium]MCW5948383.1 PaaI family thioesterase [Pyrinomonadaceae bacterium]